MTTEQAADTLRADPPKFIDILPEKRLIAASAISDRPVEGKPDVMTQAAETRAKAQAELSTADPAPPAKLADEEKTDAEAKPDEHKPDETPPWVKAFVTKEKNRRKVIEDDNRALREQLAALSAQVQQMTPPAGDKEPQREAFANDDAWLDAVADFRAALKIAKASTDAEAAAQAKVGRERLAAHNARLAKAADKYPDIEDVARDPSLPISAAMGLAIMESDAGPDILHWLDEHRQEAERIAALSPVKAAAEVGKIEAKLAEKPPVTVSKAPKPISPVGGNNAIQRSKDDPELSSAEWAAALDAERAAKAAALRH